MKEQLPPIEQAILLFLATVRGTRALTAVKYLAKMFKCTEEAMRKRLDRMAKKDLIVAVSMASGQQLYRLTRKGVQLTGAPSSFSDSPTIGVLYEMIATSNCACRTEEFIFLTRQRFRELMTERDPAFTVDKFPGRFLFHAATGPDARDANQTPVIRLAFWIAEFRPAEQLSQRITTVANGLVKSSPLFQELIDYDLFEVAVAVPTEGVTRSLQERQFPLRVTSIVVPELLEFASVPTP